MEICEKKRNRRGRWVLALLLVLMAGRASAAVGLLMEEPYGEFGEYNPTGHAAVYLSHICTDGPTQLRMCQPGELGVVISRYHKINGYDWIAVPLIPYLYAVESADDVPDKVNKEQVEALRDAYRRGHLLDVAPNKKNGGTPGGEWTQLVGSSYDRTIHGFMVDSTRAEDERFIALMNDKRNVSHFNLLFHNCADFSRSVLDIYFPHAIHRNFIADIGLTTPKQVAKSLVKYGKKHPELHMTAFVIRQVPGSVERSTPIRGVAESVVKSKKYLIPLVVLEPHVAAGAVVAYLANGRSDLSKEVKTYQVDDPAVLVRGHLAALAEEGGQGVTLASAAPREHTATSGQD